jgi:hypothetical protein
MQQDVADDDDPCAFPGEVGGERDRIACGGRCGSDEDGIACIEILRGYALPLSADVEHPCAFRQLQSPFLQIDADDLATGGAGDAGSELPHEAQPHHGDALAETNVGLAETVQRDRAKRRECRLEDVDADRHRNTEIRGHGEDLGMSGLLAAARNKVTRPDTAYAAADTLDASGCAIAERCKRIESYSNRLDCRTDPLGADLVDYLTHLVRPATSLSKQTLASDLHLRPFGAGTHEGRTRSHEHLPIIELGRGNLRHPELTVPQSLRQLLHSRSITFSLGVVL